jgi:phosphatidate cytidylyltransferase
MVRLVSGVVLGVLAIAAIWFLPLAALRVLALVVALLATSELLGISRASGRGPTAVVAYVYVLVVAYVMSVPAFPADPVLFGGLAALLVEVLFRARTLGEASTTAAAGLYIGLPIGALVAVHALAGRDAVLLLLATVVVSDSSQYYSGRLLGRHPLAPTISPKKTVEGAMGGLLFGTAAMVIGGRLVLPQVPVGTLVVIGVVVVVLGICGDLFESRLKRAVALKDSSSLIPGHGGVLDRIDALLFAAPGFYLFIQRLL